MIELQKLSQLVTDAYRRAESEWGQWVFANHVPVVAAQTQELANRYGADPTIAVAGALLHDFGDAFVHRHAPEHAEVSDRESMAVLKEAGYSDKQITKVIRDVILPHSCKDGFLPTTIEGKIMATADALAHLTTDFYLQFTWKHLPEGKNYQQHREWVIQKLERDFHTKIFFEEVRSEVSDRYLALKEVFKN